MDGFLGPDIVEPNFFALVAHERKCQNNGYLRHLKMNRSVLSEYAGHFFSEARRDRSFPVNSSGHPSSLKEIKTSGRHSDFYETIFTSPGHFLNGAYRFGQDRAGRSVGSGYWRGNHQRRFGAGL